MFQVDLLQALNGVEWPQFLSAQPDVVLQLFTYEFVDPNLTFHMERGRICDKVLKHDLERVGPCVDRYSRHGLMDSCMTSSMGLQAYIIQQFT